MTQAVGSGQREAAAGHGHGDKKREGQKQRKERQVGGQILLGELRVRAIPEMDRSGSSSDQGLGGSTTMQTQLV
jgi:hypothetical protein